MKDFNIGEWKNKLLKENQEDPAKDHFAQAEDNLYKKVTGEEPKASSGNKFRDPKEGFMGSADDEDFSPKKYDKADLKDAFNSGMNGAYQFFEEFFKAYHNE